MVSTVVVLTAVKLRTGRFVADARPRVPTSQVQASVRCAHLIKWPRWPLASLASAPRGLLWFAAVGWCNGIAALLMYAALATGPVTLVSPLVATYPLVTVGLSLRVLRKITVSPRPAVTVGLTVAGVALLIVG